MRTYDAAVVLVGVALVEGSGSTSLPGLLFGLGALGGEVAFTLLAVPLLPRLGPVTVSVHSCLIAAGQLALVAPVLAAATGTPVVRVPTAAEAAATAFLALAVTAVAFVAWYTAVGRIGSERAGLLAGLMPVAALVAGLLLGTGGATAATVAGAVLVGAGVASGLTAGAPAGPRCGRPARGPAPPSDRPALPATVTRPAGDLRAREEEPGRWTVGARTNPISGSDAPRRGSGTAPGMTRLTPARGTPGAGRG